MGTTVDTSTEVRSFQIAIPAEQIDDFRRRIAATRWPTKEVVPDRSQGVQLATLRELARYWTSEYDWGECEARLNALPQIRTNIDGVEIHFIHVRSRHEQALPLIMTHGWPGSVVEVVGVIGPLTDPTAHGGTPRDAFHLVLPSLPGYGLSGEPTELGWESGRIARAWAELMDRLDYTRYVVQGGGVGAAVTDALGRHAPEGLLGIHLDLLAGTIGLQDQLPAESPVSVPVGFTTFPGEIWTAPAAGPRPSTPPSPTSTSSTATATSPLGAAGALLHRPAGRIPPTALTTHRLRLALKEVPCQHRPLISSSSRISRTSEGRVSLRKEI